MRALVSTLLLLVQCCIMLTADQLCMHTYYGCIIDSAGGRLQCVGIEPANFEQLQPRGSYVHVSCGSGAVCALNASSHAVCFGHGAAKLKVSQTFRDLSLGGEVSRYTDFGCGVLLSDSTLVCWGSPSPRSILDPPGGQFIAVRVGSKFACAIDITNALLCFGDVLALNPAGGWPVRGQFVQLAIGEGDWVCALQRDGLMRCFGIQSALTGRFIQIAAQTRTTLCGIKPDFRAVCKGNNADGEATPPDVQFTQIAVGQFQGCGITLNGTVLCWSQFLSRLAPPQGDTFSKVALGASYFGTFACAKRANDSIPRCWGKDTSGNTLVPAIPIRDLDIGGATLCVIVASSGAVNCYPSLSGGVLAASSWTSIDVSSPSEGKVAVVDDATGRTEWAGLCQYRAADCFVLRYSLFSQISLSTNDFCGILRSNSSIMCGGFCDNGKCAIPAGQYRAVALSDNHSCFITKSDGRIGCVGSRLVWERIAAGPFIDFDFYSTWYQCYIRSTGSVTCRGSGDTQEPFSNMPGGTDHVRLFAARHSDTEFCFCSVRINGDAACFGSASPPNPFSPPSGPFADMCGVWKYFCAVRTNGQPVCWGDFPPPLPSGSNFYAVSCAQQRRTCWASLTDVQCLDGGGQALTFPVAFKSIALNSNFLCGIRRNDSWLHCGLVWNDPVSQRFAFGDTIPQGPAASVVAGGLHQFCAIMLDSSNNSNRTVCFGPNDLGQSEPPAGVAFRFVRCGESRCCGSKPDFQIVCWGVTSYGHLDAPTQPGFVQLSISQNYDCALHNSSAVFCWGSGNYGSPPGLYSQVSVSYLHPYACGVRLDGSIYCWRHTVSSAGALAPIGFYRKGSRLLPCPAGVFSIAPGATTELCSGVCTPGTYASAISSTRCSLCQPGTTCPNYGMSAPDICPSGTFNPITGHFRTCTPCAKGFFCPPGTGILRDLCPAGRYGDVIGLQDAFCSGNCPAGYGCAPGTIDPYSNPCRPGSFSAGLGLGSCAKCAAGRYTSQTTATSCTDCDIGRYSSSDGRDSLCAPCDAGYFTSTQGSSFCRACLPGTFGSPPGFCSPCPAGSFTTLSGQAQCAACSPGSYTPLPGASICRVCEPGRFQALSGASLCAACSAGAATQTAGQASCLECGEGTYANDTGSSDCQPCLPGSFSAAASQSNCALCPIGKYSTTRGLTSCSECSLNTVAARTGSTSCSLCPRRSSNSLTTCICEKGLVAVVQADGSVECVDCPKGARCDREGVDVNAIQTEEGFWMRRTGNDTLPEFMRCLRIAHCAAGQTSSDCKYNRAGVLCALCKPGYQALTADAPCGLCPDTDEATLLSVSLSAAALVVLGILLFCFVRSEMGSPASQRRHSDWRSNLIKDSAHDKLKRRRSSASAENIARSGSRASLTIESTGIEQIEEREEMLAEAQITAGQVLNSEMRSPATMTYNIKLTVGFLQVMTNIAFVAQVSLPSIYASSMNYINLVNLEFIQWEQVECVATIDFYQKLVVIMLLPPLVMLLIGLFVFIPLKLKDCREDLSDDQLARQRRNVLFGKIYKIMLFLLFLFYPGVSRKVLSFFSCREVNGVSYLLADFSLHCGTSDDRWTGFLGPALVGVIVYPIGIPALFLFLLIRNRQRLREADVIAWAGFLYEGYARSMWWFELVDTAVRLFLTSMLTFIPVEAQMIAGMIVTLLYLCTIFLASPYLRSRDDRMSQFVQMEIILLLLAGLVIQNEGSPEANSLIDVLLSAVLLAVTFAVLLVFIYHAVLRLKESYRDTQWRKFQKTLSSVSLEPLQTNDNPQQRKITL